MGNTHMPRASVSAKNILIEASEYEKELQQAAPDGLNPTDICIALKSINMGKGECNPVTKILFYEKNKETVEITNNDLLDVAPTQIKTESLFILLRSAPSDNEEMKKWRAFFSRWSSQNNFKIELL